MKYKLLLILPLILLISGCVETIDKNGNVITPTPTPLAVSEDLGIEDIKEGEGEVVRVGDTVSVHYVGRLKKNNKIFDSSKEKKQPFNFTIGKGEVIVGWDQGVQGMRIGGIRKLTIPPQLGYGESGAGDIGPNDTIVFRVELLEKIEN